MTPRGSVPTYNELAVTRHGVMLANVNDTFVGRSIHRYGEFSRAESGFFRSILPDGAFVVEVGANIGALTVPLARYCSAVIAIEPQRIPFQTLCANAQLNSLTNVFALHAACGRETGRVPIIELDPWREQNFGGTRLSHADETTPRYAQVPLFRLDDVLADWDMPVAMLKIDVEGMEQDVMVGGYERIKKDRPILYFENDRVETYFERVEWVVNLFGYRVFQHLAPLYTPDNFKANPDNIFADMVSGNCVAVPPESPLVPVFDEVAEKIELGEVAA